MRRNVNTGTAWEDLIGYSRAVSVGDSAWVAGTTATVDGQVVGVDDPYEQTRVAFGIAVEALRSAGFDLTDVVCTRVFMTNIAHFDEVGRAHNSLFDAVRPVTTLIEVSALRLPEHLVEVELEARRAT